MPAAAGSFEGFDPAALAFLRGLAANNAKPWFEANRAQYERSVKQPVAALIDAVTTELSRRGLPLEGDPKRSAFRIHRDTRFSHDKSPYKTSVGVVWYRQGSGKDGAGVLYFHLAPEGCFVAAAFYRPEPDALDAIRERIRVHPERWRAVQHELEASGLALEGQAVARMPRGYEDLRDTVVAPAIRMKSYLVRRTMAEADVSGPNLVNTVAGMAEAGLPLLRFGWAAIDEVAQPGAAAGPVSRPVRSRRGSA